MNSKLEPYGTTPPHPRDPGRLSPPMPVILRRYDVVRARVAKEHEIARLGLSPGDWVFEIHRAGVAHPLIYPTTVVLHYPGSGDEQ